MGDLSESFSGVWCRNDWGGGGVARKCQLHYSFLLPLISPAPPCTGTRWKVDGSEIGETIPLRPLIVAERKLDLIIAYEASLDVEYSWAAGPMEPI